MDWLSFIQALIENFRPELPKIATNLSFFAGAALAGLTFKNIDRHKHFMNFINVIDFFVKKMSAPRKARSLLLDLLLPSKIAKDAQINLEEMLPVWVGEHGWFWANIIHFVEKFRLIFGHWITKLQDAAKLIFKIVRG